MGASVFALLRLRRSRTVRKHGRRLHRYEATIPSPSGHRPLNIRVEAHSVHGTRLPSNSLAWVEGFASLWDAPPGADINLKVVDTRSIRPVFRGQRSTLSFHLTGKIQEVRDQDGSWCLLVTVERQCFAGPGWVITYVPYLL